MLDSIRQRVIVTDSLVDRVRSKFEKEGFFMHWVLKRDYRGETKAEPKTPYVRVHPRATYISAAIASEFGSEYAAFGHDKKKGLLVIRPSTSEEGFKLSFPDASVNPRRVESANICIDLIKDLFPIELLGEYLPATIDDYGFIKVDYTELIRGEECVESKETIGGHIAIQY